MPFALAAALTAALLGAVGGATGPVAADDNPSAPAQQDGGGSQPRPQGDGAGAGDGAGDGTPAGPQQAGGGNLPGEKPASDSAPGSDTGPRPYTDAAPPVDPGFVDTYTRLWKQVERGKLKVRSLGEDLVGCPSGAVGLQQRPRDGAARPQPGRLPPDRRL